MSKEPYSEVRVSDANSARQMFDHARSDHEIARVGIDDIIYLIEGALPDDPDWLDDQGMSDSSNVNWRKAENVVEVRETIYHNRAHLEETLATFHSTIEGIDEERRMEIGAIISTRFTELLNRSQKFILQRQAHRRRYVRTGHGHMYWPSKTSYIPESIPFSLLVTPSDATVWLDKWDVFFILGTETISSLYSRVRTPEGVEASSEAGWNPDQIRKTIYARDPNSPRDTKGKRIEYTDSAYQDFLDTITNNSLAYSHLSKEVIPVVHMFTKEFDGSWSRRVFMDDPEVDGYLLEQEGAYNSVNELLCGYWMTVQDDELHYSVQGVIHKMFNEIVTNNNIMNSLVDLLEWMTSIVMDGGSSQDPDAHEFTRRGNIVMTPTGTTINADLMKAFDASGVLGVFSLLDSNTERKQMMDASSLAGKGSVQPAAAHEIKVQQSNISDFHASELMTYDIYDKEFYKEVYRRVMSPDYDKHVEGWEDVKLLRRMLKEDGLEAKHYDPKNLLIAPTPSIGLGSAEYRKSALQLLMSNIGMFDASGQERVKKLWTMGVVGSDGAKALLPSSENLRATESERMAFFENLFLQQGQSVPAVGSDDHIAHFRIHTTPVFQILQTMQQQGQPPQVETLLPYMGAVISHAVQHLQFSANDKVNAQQVKGMSDALEELDSAFKELQAFAQQQQAQAEQQAAQQQQMQQEMTPEMQLAMREQDQKMSLRERDVNDQIAQRNKKTEAKLNADRRKMDARIAQDTN